MPVWPHLLDGQKHNQMAYDRWHILPCYTEISTVPLPAISRCQSQFFHTASITAFSNFTFHISRQLRLSAKTTKYPDKCPGSFRKFNQLLSKNVAILKFYYIHPHHFRLGYNYQTFLKCFDAVGWVAGRASGLQKSEWWGAGMVICLEWHADLYMAQLMPLPLAVSCFSEIQIGFTFLVLAHLGSTGRRAMKRVCV